MKDLIGLPMHQFFCSHDLSPRGLPDGLMTEAYAKQGQLAREAFDTRDGNASFFGSAGPWRNDQMRRLHSPDFIQSDLIVSKHADIQIRIHLAQALDEVVRKRIVV